MQEHSWLDNFPVLQTKHRKQDRNHFLMFELLKEIL